MCPILISMKDVQDRSLLLHVFYINVILNCRRSVASHSNSIHHSTPVVISSCGRKSFVPDGDAVRMLSVVCLLEFVKMLGFMPNFLSLLRRPRNMYVVSKRSPQ